LKLPSYWAEDETPSAKCFGFVQTYDDKPRRRLWELMKSQGMKENQQVVSMSDGGETVRRLQEYLHPCSEHVIDWFHIIMECASLWNVSCSWRAHVPDYQIVLVDERSDFFP